jgi:hypothetical protein
MYNADIDVEQDHPLHADITKRVFAHHCTVRKHERVTFVKGEADYKIVFFATQNFLQTTWSTTNQLSKICLCDDQKCTW